MRQRRLVVRKSAFRPDRHVEQPPPPPVPLQPVKPQLLELPEGSTHPFLYASFIGVGLVALVFFLRTIGAIP